MSHPVLLQPGSQAPIQPATSAAQAVGKAALEMLAARLGQTFEGMVLGQLANSLTQLRFGGETLAVRLQPLLPPGQPVQVTIQPTPQGVPALLVQPRAAAIATPSIAPPPVSPAVPTTPAPVAPAPTATTRPAPPPATTRPIVSSLPTATSVAPPAASQPAAPAPPASPALSLIVATRVEAQPAQTAPAHTVTGRAVSAPLAAGQSLQSAPSAAAPPPSGPMTAATAPAIASAPTTARQPAASPPGGTRGAAPEAIVPAPARGIVPTMTAAPLRPTSPRPTSQPAPQAAASGASRPPAPAAGATAAKANGLSPAQPTARTAAMPRASASQQARPVTVPAVLNLTQPAQAAARQDSLAPLLQNIGALAARAVSLPAPVAEAATRLLAQRVSLDRGQPGAEILRQAVVRAGVLAPPGTGAPATPPDVKTALLQLRASLIGMLGGSDGELAPVAPVGRRSPPPMRDTQPRGLRAEGPTLPETAPPREAARTLLNQTDSALARLKLTQLASQPVEARAGASPVLDLTVEIPMMLGHELALAQLNVQRDGKSKGKAGERGWRLRFAVNFSVVGEVGAQVSLLGQTTSVVLWAAEADTAAALEMMLPELAPALAARGLQVGGVKLRRGAPQAPTPAAGRLMDASR